MQQQIVLYRSILNGESIYFEAHFQMQISLYSGVRSILYQTGFKYGTSWSFKIWFGFYYRLIRYKSVWNLKSGLLSVLKSGIFRYLAVLNLNLKDGQAKMVKLSKAKEKLYSNRIVSDYETNVNLLLTRSSFFNTTQVYKITKTLCVLC